MQIRWLRKALRNLDENATYIAADDVTAARMVVRRIFEAVGQLTVHPVHPPLSRSRGCD
jgi:plasmid stabilization system protein ParE